MPGNLPGMNDDGSPRKKIVSSFLEVRQRGQYGGEPMHTTDTPSGTAAADRFMALKETEHVSGIRKSAIYALVKEGRFPRPARLSSRCVRWSFNQVQEWIQERKAAAGIDLG